MARMGNTGASSLVSASASISSQVADYNDKLKAYQWENSAQTDEEYAQYSKYLSSRVEKLQGVGTMATASKALTVISTARSASRSYTSNSIQRVSMAIMTGGANSTTKLEQIRQLYIRAADSGDNNLAQNLLQQYYSLDQQIQYEAVANATAGQALADKNAAAQEKGYANYISQIEDTVKSMNNALAEGGQQLSTKELKSYADSLGIDFKGAAPTAGSLVQGAINLTKDAYAEAAMVAGANGDEQGAQSYYDKINAIDNDITSVGGFTASEANSWAQNSNSIVMVYDKEGVIGTDKNGTAIVGSIYKPTPAAIESYTFDASGAVVPVYSKVSDASGKQFANQDISNNKDSSRDNTIKELQALGLNVDVKSDGSIVVTTTTSGTSEAFAGAGKPLGNLFKDMESKYGIAPGTQLRVSKVGEGYQFHVGGQENQILLYLAKDNSGKYGMFKQEHDIATNGMRFNLVGTTDSRFNPLDNVITRTQGTDNVAVALQKSFENYSKQPQGYTEKTIIPDIARRYFNGDTTAATKAVYDYRKPLEQPQVKTPVPIQVAQNMRTVTPAFTPTPKINVSTNVIPIGGNAAPAATPSSSDGYYNQVVKNQLSTYFQDFKNKPNFYTEKTILPEVANKFYGGDVSKASAYVYKYRKENFGS